MGEGEFLDARICAQSFSKHTKCLVRHPVVRHVEQLEVLGFDEIFIYRLHLHVSKLVSDKMQLPNRKNTEQASEYLAANLIVVHVEVSNLTLLDLVDQLSCALIVNLVVLEL